VLYIVIVTPICNIACKYCGGSLKGMPPDIIYDIEELANFVGKDREAIVAFYGGEPLLRVEKVKEMLDILPAKKFVLQTNGFFIKKLGNYLHKIDAILLSIDGRKEITDFYRCKGCYDKVMEALSFIKENDYRGEIIARMAVSYKTDIYEDVMHLLHFFPYVHWQLDVVWSNLWNLREFEIWVEKIYKPGIRKLIDYWRKKIEVGEIMGIIPFLGIMKSILYGGNGLPCQAGKGAVAISTDGKVLACPIAPDFKWNILGDFKKFKEIEVGEPCKSCNVYKICGGRCLFTYKERLWGEEGFRKICEVTKFLIYELIKHRDVCEQMKDKFTYPHYNNTTEIIP